ncbi:MAG TPA: hypothetical protein VG496_05080 [Myxococcales bacterium]|nr:hypothetical protein [Myxococcales bacterium]
MRLSLLLLFASLAARAWDPTDVASVDARVAELRAAWSGKSATAVANDKLARARQKAKPTWVSRQAFRIQDASRRLYLGVGSVALPPAALRAGALEDAPPVVEGVMPLDWYLDEASGTLYALSLEEKR